MKKMSSIIPIRTNDFSFYRRRLDIRRSMDLSVVQTIVVDDGSEILAASEIKVYCDLFGFDYIRIESSDRPFSLSRARNYGIYASSCEWIIMEDADIIYAEDFYNKLMPEVDLIDETPFNFLTIPVVYLKEGISESVFSSGAVDTFIPRILMASQFENPKGSPENKIVESFSPATALFVVRKATLMHVGAYDEYFEGWGGEDRDIAYRMLAFNDKFKKPSEFEVTKNWNLNETSEYKGWRAFYRLTGDYLASKGFYGFHLFHEKLEWRTNAGGAININYAKDKAVILSKKRAFFPKFDMAKKVNVIIGHNPHVSNSQIFELLDNVVVLDDAANQDVDAVIAKIIGFNVGCIIFWNPYGSDWRLRLCKKLRELNYRVIVAERGALPESFYFDEGGLCVESNTYQTFEKNRMLDDNDRLLVREYILELRYGSSALESQSSRIGVGAVRLKLNIPQDKKIFFVPLQVETDTVTNFFIEPDRGYQDFLGEIRRLAAYVSSEWVVVIKNHPLNSGKVNIPGVVVGDSFHVNDLIEASSAVGLFNSGVGLISMAFDKPVFYYGKCFYAIESVNERFTSARELVGRLNLGLKVNKDMVERFYYFLLNEFYSFAKVTVDKTEANKATTQLMDFRIIRIPSFKEMNKRVWQDLTGESIILGRYREFFKLQGCDNLLTSKLNNFPSADMEKPAFEGMRVTASVPSDKKNVVSQAELGKADKTVKSRMAFKTFCAISYPFLSSKQRKKLHDKPAMFFADSKSSVANLFRRFIF